MKPSLGRFRYRRSLASRVILLTTFAVGLSVAIVALAAYLTVRHQLQSTMDESLHRRAYLAARYEVNSYTVREIPAWIDDVLRKAEGTLRALAFFSPATSWMVVSLCRPASWASCPAGRACSGLGSTTTRSATSSSELGGIARPR